MRARADWETSPDLAFIFSRPIMNSETTRAWVGRPELDRVCEKPVKSMPRKYESSPLACDFMGNPLIHPFLRTKSAKPQSKGSMGRYGSGILSPLISLGLWTTLMNDKEANVIQGLPGDKLWIPSVTISLFFFLHRSSYASLLYRTNFAPLSWSALRLNSASSALRRAGLLSFYGRPLFFMRSPLHSLLPFYRTDHLPFISVLAFPLQTLLGPCAGSPRI